MVSPRADSARSVGRLCLCSAACCLLASMGCNNGRQLQADLYQRELRLQEDEIYRLEDYIEEYQAIIRGYRCEVAELKQQLVENATEPAEPDAPVDGAPPAASERLERIEPIEMLPTPETDEGPAFNAEPPNPTGEAPPFDPATDTPADAGGLIETPAMEPAPLFESSSATPIESSIAGSSAAPSASATDTPAELPARATPEAIDVSVVAHNEPGVSDRQVEVHVTRGRSMTGAPTLSVVVREQAAAALAGFDGHASVMITDPSVNGRLRRVALWDFTDREVGNAWGVDPDGGAQIELPIQLPSQTPRDRPLRVWVRLVEPGGRKTLRAAEVRFAGPALRLVRARPLPLAMAPARLPSTGDQPARSITNNDPTESLVADTRLLANEHASTEAGRREGWRTARSPHRYDPAVRAAAAFAPVAASP